MAKKLDKQALTLTKEESLAEHPGAKEMPVPTEHTSKPQTSRRRRDECDDSLDTNPRSSKRRRMTAIENGSELAAWSIIPASSEDPKSENTARSSPVSTEQKATESLDESNEQELDVNEVKQLCNPIKDGYKALKDAEKAIPYNTMRELLMSFEQARTSIVGLVRAKHEDQDKVKSLTKGLQTKSKEVDDLREEMKSLKADNELLNYQLKQLGEIQRGQKVPDALEAVSVGQVNSQHRLDIQEHEFLENDSPSTDTLAQTTTDKNEVEKSDNNSDNNTEAEKSEDNEDDGRQWDCNNPVYHLFYDGSEETELPEDSVTPTAENEEPVAQSAGSLTDDSFNDDSGIHLGGDDNRDAGDGSKESASEDSNDGDEDASVGCLGDLSAGLQDSEPDQVTEVALYETQGLIEEQGDPKAETAEPAAEPAIQVPIAAAAKLATGSETQDPLSSTDREVVASKGEGKAAKRLFDRSWILYQPRRREYRHQGIHGGPKVVRTRHDHSRLKHDPYERQHQARNKLKAAKVAPMAKSRNRFSPKDPVGVEAGGSVAVVEVQPQECSLVEMVNMNDGIAIDGLQSQPFDVAQDMEVEGYVTNQHELQSQPSDLAQDMEIEDYMKNRHELQIQAFGAVQEMQPGKRDEQILQGRSARFCLPGLTLVQPLHDSFVQKPVAQTLQILAPPPGRVGTQRRPVGVEQQPYMENSGGHGGPREQSAQGVASRRLGANGGIPRNSPGPTGLQIKFLNP